MISNARNIQPPQRAPDESGMTQLWQAVKQHRRLFFATIGVTFVAGVLYALLATPQYRAEALLRVQTKPGSSISSLSDVSGTIAASPSASDESEMLISRAVIDSAIDATGADLDIRNASRFPVIGSFVASRFDADDTLAPAPLGLTGYAWGGERLDIGEFSIPANALGDRFRIVADDANTWTLQDDDNRTLAHGKVGETVPFRLPGESTAGRLRVDVLRARPGIAFTVRKQPEPLVYENVSKHLKTVVPNRDSTLESPSMIRLSYQADSAREAKNMVNAIVQQYLQRDLAFRTDRARRNLDSLRQRLPVLKQDLQKAEDDLNRYRTQNGAIDVDQQGAALITRLNTLAEHQTALQISLDDVRQRFLPKSFQYQTVQSQLDQVKREIRDTSATAARLPTTQREFVRLSRQVTIATQLYTSVLTNAQQLELTISSASPGVTAVDWAVAPFRPVWPKRGIVVLGALLAGVFLALTGVHLLSLYRRELHSPAALARLTDSPCLAIVASSPALAALPGGPRPTALPLAAAHPDDAGIESVRALRASLKAALATHGDDSERGKVLLLTGVTAGVGCSFVSSNLAYLLAGTNASVLLINADLRVSSMAGGPGLAQVLDGSVSPDTVTLPVAGSHLSIMPAGAPVKTSPGELLEGSGFMTLILAMREQYDFVVIDGPPLLPNNDALGIVGVKCDAHVLVSRSGMTRAADVETALSRLRSIGGDITGYVFNTYTGSTRPVVERVRTRGFPVRSTERQRV
ncbi:TPA: multidrug MFS transporter [Burkholderia cepacia ATCC 25416]|uniref:GNVR domain-containing protein n=2 Tax=Burkholderiaceae TaxID=119060 RepID=UPI00075D02A6|nr:multidrug MFS transporter [Burkholderia cepacia]HDR9768137.1 multidrug MFS transporter [Burkholderia cepacia ATCC 25416]KVA26691.1 multidrug MFS transporter [Burkholderia cepacia]KVA45864.1 multidrug MFS transporter [Burkholderia cepacia]KVE87003.1 multidrug MFS transporter [Burkholderia cepacia]